MCAEHLHWIKHSFFVSGRPRVVGVSFTPSSNPRQLSISSGSLCTFTDGWQNRSVFINRCLIEGVYHWSLKVTHPVNKREKPQFGVGAAPPGLLKHCDSEYLGFVKGTVSFYCRIYPRMDDTLLLSLFGTKQNINFSLKNTPLTNGPSVAIEADSATQTLSFFMNEKKFGRVISGVTFPLYFGVTGNGGLSFTSVCFLRLPSATPTPPQKCRLYEGRWGMGE